eukprot:1552282-Amphidinium_carterae.2
MELGVTKSVEGIKLHLHTDSASSKDETVTPTLYVRRGEDVSIELHCNSDHDSINLKAMIGSVFLTVHYDEAAMQHVDDPKLLSAIWLDHFIALYIGRTTRCPSMLIP